GVFGGESHVGDDDDDRGHDRQQRANRLPELPLQGALFRALPIVVRRTRLGRQGRKRRPLLASQGRQRRTEGLDQLRVEAGGRRLRGARTREDGDPVGLHEGLTGRQVLPGEGGGGGAGAVVDRFTAPCSCPWEGTRAWHFLFAQAPTPA